MNANETLTIEVIRTTGGFEIQSAFGDRVFEEDLLWLLRCWEDRRHHTRVTPLPQRVLEGLIGVYELDRTRGRIPNLQVKRVAKAANFLDRRLDGRKADHFYSARKIGGVLRRDLKLRTERVSPKLDPNRPFWVVWDAERIKVLRDRFEIDDARLAILLNILRE